MDFRSLLEISLTLTVLLFSSQLIKVVDSKGSMQRFATAKCHHRKLSNKMIGMSKCTDGHVNEFSKDMFDGYKDYLNENGKVVDLTMGCRIHNEHFGKAQRCFMGLVNSCLPGWISPWFSRILNALELDCDCPMTESDPCFIIDIQELQQAGQDLANHAESVRLDLPRYLLSYVLFDKPCDFGFMMNATQAQMVPCMESEYQGLGQPIYEYIIGNSNDLSGVSPCTSMRNVLDRCFGENQCVSGREMRLVRDLVATIYKRGMETLIQIEDEFGSLANFVTAHVDSTFKWHQHELHFNDLGQINMSDVYVQRVFEVASHVIQDFKDEGCRSKRAALSRMDLRMMVEDNGLLRSNLTQSQNVTTNMTSTYMTTMANTSMNMTTAEPSMNITTDETSTIMTTGESSMTMITEESSMNMTTDGSSMNMTDTTGESAGSNLRMQSVFALFVAFIINVYI